MRAIGITLEGILQLIEEHGYLPIFGGVLPRKEYEYHYSLNFCFGTPGLVPMLTLAA